MDWSQHSIPAMRLEPRFGDRLVPAFCERPKSIPAMVADAVARNPNGEALVCGDRRMNWREVEQHSQQIAAGFQKLGLQRGDRVAVLLGNRIEFVLTMLGAAHAGRRGRLGAHGSAPASARRPLKSGRTCWTPSRRTTLPPHAISRHGRACLASGWPTSPVWRISACAAPGYKRCP